MIQAKIDASVRAAIVLARHEGRSLHAAEIAEASGVPVAFLRGILTDLRRHGLVVSRRGQHGGYRLARPAIELTVADVVEASGVHLVQVRGALIDHAEYTAATGAVPVLWDGLDVAIRTHLAQLRLSDLAS